VELAKYIKKKKRHLPRTAFVSFLSMLYREIRDLAKAWNFKPDI